jgi:hypothetical protein
MLPCLIGFHDFIFLIGGKHDWVGIPLY